MVDEAFGLIDSPLIPKILRPQVGVTGLEGN
jgi:hypothetical protein